MRVAGSVLPSALLVLGALCSGEALFRAVFPLPELANFNRIQFSELAADRLSGRRPLMNASFRWTSEPDGVRFDHTLNLYGFRDASTWCVRPGRRRHRVMFVGDSFVEGVMASDDDTISVAFARASKRPVEAMNLGIGGTGISHYFRLIATAVPLFRPQTLVLVLYANDLPPPPFDEGWLSPASEPRYFRRWLPRPWHVVRRAVRGEPVPRRWHAAAFAFFAPVPDTANPLTTRPPGYEPLIEPRLLGAMKRGAFNPYLADHLARSAEGLPQEADLRPHLDALRAFTARYKASLLVAYLPHALQVSDHYMQYTLRYAVEKPVRSLRGRAYQQHADALLRSCDELAIRCIDLTGALRAEEAKGSRLYWDYDNHMRGAGYSFVGRRLREALSAD